MDIKNDKITFGPNLNYLFLYYLVAWPISVEFVDEGIVFTILRYKSCHVWEHYNHYNNVCLLYGYISLGIGYCWLWKQLEALLLLWTCSSLHLCRKWAEKHLFNSQWTFLHFGYSSRVTKHVEMRVLILGIIGINSCTWSRNLESKSSRNN